MIKVEEHQLMLNNAQCFSANAKGKKSPKGTKGDQIKIQRISDFLVECIDDDGGY